jgi:hypothetical protein
VGGWRVVGLVSAGISVFSIVIMSPTGCFQIFTVDPPCLGAQFDGRENEINARDPRFIPALISAQILLLNGPVVHGFLIDHNFTSNRALFLYRRGEFLFSQRQKIV